MRSTVGEERDLLQLQVLRCRLTDMPLLGNAPHADASRGRQGKIGWRDLPNPLVNLPVLHNSRPHRELLEASLEKRILSGSQWPSNFTYILASTNRLAQLVICHREYDAHSRDPRNAKALSGLPRLSGFLCWP